MKTQIIDRTTGGSAGHPMWPNIILLVPYEPKRIPRKLKKKLKKGLKKL